MKYKIITSNDAVKMSERVNVLIVDGWEPLGGVSMAMDNNGFEYAQAMVKKSTALEKAGVKP